MDNKIEEEFSSLSYVPRKCSASNRIISAKDHASVQISFVDVDPQTGRMLDTCKTYAISGKIRLMGESDDCVARLAGDNDVASRKIAVHYVPVQ